MTTTLQNFEFCAVCLNHHANVCLKDITKKDTQKQDKINACLHNNNHIREYAKLSEEEKPKYGTTAYCCGACSGWHLRIYLKDEEGDDNERLEYWCLYCKEDLKPECVNKFCDHYCMQTYTDIYNGHTRY